jgi:RNA polymerase sigma-70 factor (ECF subfamily)
MDRIEQNERESIVQAVIRYQPMIQSYSFAIVRDFHLAEDVFQDVAMIVARNWDKLPPEEELVPWLKETTRRKSLEAARKHRRAPSALPEEALEAIGEQFALDLDDPDEEQRTEAMYNLMEKCLDQMQDPARHVLQMRYGERTPRSCDQIAAAMGRSRQAIYSIIKRSRLALIRCVEASQAPMEQNEASP